MSVLLTRSVSNHLIQDLSLVDVRLKESMWGRLEAESAKGDVEGAAPKQRLRALRSIAAFDGQHRDMLGAELHRDPPEKHEYWSQVGRGLSPQLDECDCPPGRCCARR